MEKPEKECQKCIAVIIDPETKQSQNCPENAACLLGCEKLCFDHAAELMRQQWPGAFGHKSDSGEEGEVKGGCPFFFRCPQAQRVCGKETPALRQWDHREVACHFPEKQNLRS